MPGRSRFAWAAISALLEPAIRVLLLIACATVLYAGSTPVTITLNSSPGSVPSGSPVTLTASISAAKASGRVAFYDNAAAVLGTAPVSGGQASIATPLSSGVHRLTARYLGDAIYEAGISAAIVEQVTSSPQSGFGDIGAYATGGNAVFVAQGDLNRDGSPDLVVACPSTGAIDIFLGSAAGTFTQAAGPGVAANANPVSIAIGDFNGDGFADLAVANRGTNGVPGSGNITVFLANGTGGFKAGVPYPAGTGPVSIATADFNEDGILDLAVADDADGGINILAGNGDGSFQPAEFARTGTNPRSIAVADYNGDGHADIAVADSNLTGDGPGDIALLLGKGDGRFAAPARYPAGANPVSITAADLNGDGTPDIAAADPNNGSASVFLSNGDGTLKPPVSYRVAGANAITSADFNGDGKADLAVVSGSGNQVTILMGYGNGTFRAARASTAGSGPNFVVAGDFNGDGRADLAVANATAGTISVLLGAAPYDVTMIETGLAPAGADNGRALMNKRNGAFSGPGTAPSSTVLSASPAPSRYGQAVTLTATVTPAGATGKVAFYDGATLLDTNAIAITTGTASFSTSFLSTRAHSLRAVYTGDSTYAGSIGPLAQTVTTVSESGFAAATAVSISGTPSQMVTGDFNNDGKPDVAVVETTSISVFLGNGSGGFQAPPKTTSITASYIAIGDFNGDGNADLAAITSGTATILLGNGDGSFTSKGAEITDARQMFSLVVGDFNGDGNADIAIADGGLTVHLGNGDGTFGPATTYTVAQGSSIAAADFNGDNKVDLVVGGSAGAVVFLGIGDAAGSFQTGVVWNAGTSLAGVAGRNLITTGDFTGTGKIDIAAIGQSTGTLLFLAGDGTGSFAAPVSIALNASPISITTGDFNGDGIQDVGVGQEINIAAGLNYLLSVSLGSVNGLSAAVTNYSTGTSPVSVVAADFNNDGRADIVTANDSDKTLSILLGRAPATVALTTSLSPSPYGQQVTLTATLTPSLATGYVTFYNGAQVLGTSIVSNGTAVFQTTLLTPGTGALTATYSGDTTHSLAYSTLLGGETITATTQNGVTLALSLATTSPQAVAAGDFNGDGDTDLAVANYTAGTVSIFLGAGNGTFTIPAPPSIASGQNPNSIAVGDFNLDGKPDLVVSNGNSVTLLQGNGNGTFATPRTIASTAQTAAVAVVVADFNLDGNPDVAFVTDVGAIGILLGKGDGTFPTGAIFGAGYSATSMVAGDFNGDGRVDLAVATGTENTVSVLIGNGDGTFKGAVTYASGEFASSIAVGDFNADTKQDLVVTDLNSNSVGIFLGNGDGTFADAVFFAAGQHPGAVITGDFNTDGYTDLAVADELDNGISLLYGNGQGAFGSPLSTPTGGLPLALATGDFNNDGRVDLATGNYNSNSVSILLGREPGPDLAIQSSHTGSFSTGQGGFTYTLTVTNSGNAPSSGTVTVIDSLPTGLTATAMSGTGWACTLVSLTCTRADALGATRPYPAITLTVNVAINAGANVTNTATVSGGGDINAFNNTSTDATSISMVGQTVQTISFAPPATHAGSGVFTVTASSNSSLAVTLTSSTPGVCSVSGYNVTPVSAGACILTATQPGNATYAAATPVTRTVVLSSTALTTSVSLTSSLNPVVYGAGTTLTATLSPAATSGQVTFYDDVTVLASRMVANGKASAAVTVPTSGGRRLHAYYTGNLANASALSPTLTQQVRAFPATGTFQPEIGNAAGNGPWAVVAGDFNGDGNADLAISNQNANSISVWLGNGDRTFRFTIDTPTALSPTAIIAGDFNADGNLDLAYASSSGLNILLGGGDGAFTPGASYPISGTGFTLAAADFNGDGYLDLAIGTNQNGVNIFLGNGDGTFQTGAVYSVGSAITGVAVGDFKGDGVADLAIGAANGSVYILIGAGDGTFTVSPTSYSLPLNTTFASLTVADFDGDGNTDIAAAGYVDTSSPGTVSVLLGNGNGTFQNPVTSYIVGTEPRAIAAADFDGDGVPDLAVANFASNNVSFLHGTGGGVFAAAVPLSTDNGPWNLAVADWNGDGVADIATANNTAKTISLILGDPIPQSQTITFAAPATVTLPAAAFTLTASASSGLPVSFSSSTTGTCTVSDGTLTPKAAGTCTVVASQAGDADYLAAATITKSFTINPAPSGGNGSGGGSGGGVISTSSLTANPAALIFNLPAGSAATSQTVTLSYQASALGAPTFFASGGSSQGQWLGISATSGALTTNSGSGSLTYSASVKITANPTGLAAGATYNGTYLFNVNGSLASVPVTLNIVASQTVVLPHFAVGGSYTTVICALNSASQAATFSAAFRGDNGTPATLNIAGLGSVTTLSGSVPALGMQCYTAANAQAATITGSILVNASPGITIQALFRNLAADGNYYEASIPPSGGGFEWITPFDGTTFAATGNPTFIGLALANMDSAHAASVTCTARDSGGNFIPNAVSVPQLNPGGHWSGYQFPALAGLRGTIDCAASTQIAMLALRFLGYSAFSSLPVVAPGASLGTSIPHFAAGGSYVTGFFVMNTSTAAANFSIAFRDDSGSPLALTITGAGSVSTLSGTVPARGLQYYEASSTSGQTLSGSGMITAGAGIAVQALFRNHAGDGNYYEASVPTGAGNSEFEIPFDGTTFAPTGNPTYTGIAIADPGSAAATISCTARDQGGNVIPNAVTVSPLSAGGHWSGYQFPALAGKQGTIDCLSSAPVSAIGLRFLGTYAFSSLPIIAK